MSLQVPTTFLDAMTRRNLLVAASDLAGHIAARLENGSEKSQGVLYGSLVNTLNDNAVMQFDLDEVIELCLLAVPAYATKEAVLKAITDDAGGYTNLGLRYKGEQAMGIIYQQALRRLTN